MTDRQTIPAVPLVLGLAGLLPFWALALALLIGKAMPVPPAQLAMALAAYGAIILSFLGGIRWGLAMANVGSAGHYGVSIVISLLAWTLFLVPDPWRFAGLGVVVLASGPLDQHRLQMGSAPPWFGRLRLILSGAAGAALLLAAVATR